MLNKFKMVDRSSETSGSSHSEKTKEQKISELRDALVDDY